MQPTILAPANGFSLCALFLSETRADISEKREHGRRKRRRRRKRGEREAGSRGAGKKKKSETVVKSQHQTRRTLSNVGRMVVAHRWPLR